MFSASLRLTGWQWPATNSGPLTSKQSESATKVNYDSRFLQIWLTIICRVRLPPPIEFFSQEGWCGMADGRRRLEEQKIFLLKMVNRPGFESIRLELWLQRFRVRFRWTNGKRLLPLEWWKVGSKVIMVIINLTSNLLAVDKSRVIEGSAFRNSIR